MKTFLLSLIVTLCAMFSGLALATQPGNNGGGNGGCGVGQQTNGCGGQGGAGGAGGSGGNGLGVGVGIANAAANAAAVAGANSTATGGNAAVVGSGNSNVRNTNNNANMQGQSQSSSNRNNNQSSAMGGNATGGAANAASGGNTLTGGSTAVTVQGDTVYAPAQERDPVATAYAAPLTASNGTCMGSSSGGAQSAAFGFSVGTTWTDGSCDIRYDAEALRAAGLPMAARARLCQKPEIAKAMEAAGTPCPKARTAAAEGYGLGQPVAKQQPMPWQAGG